MDVSSLFVSSRTKFLTDPLVPNMASGNSEKAGLQVFDNEETKAGSSTLTVEMSRDEYTLATLGYRQVFVRSFGLFENVRATST